MAHIRITSWAIGTSATAVVGLIAAVLFANPMSLTQAMLRHTPLAQTAMAADAETVRTSSDNNVHLTSDSYQDSPFITSSNQTFAIGDKITVSGKNGGSHVYVINAMQPLSIAHISEVATSSPYLVLVTGRAVGKPGAKPFRFIIETQAPLLTPQDMEQKQES